MQTKIDTLDGDNFLNSLWTWISFLQLFFFVISFIMYALERPYPRPRLAALAPSRANHSAKQLEKVAIPFHSLALCERRYFVIIGHSTRGNIELNLGPANTAVVGATADQVLIAPASNAMRRSRQRRILLFAAPRASLRPRTLRRGARARRYSVSS
jgi:hypothetical protein